MGRTPKPLTILVHPSLKHWPEWEQLQAQGHMILDMYEPHNHEMGIVIADLIVGPTSWYMTEKHRKYLDQAIKVARSVRYQNQVKRKVKK